MAFDPIGRTIPDVEHHRAVVNGTELHYVTAGRVGTPVLLIHGFPESWWAFRGLIPMLAGVHRVIAVDLRGFGDSGPAASTDTSGTLADDLHALVEQLGLGPVHLLAQDISGAVALRLAVNHPEELLSLIGVETGFAGYGLEVLADVGRSGAWYIGPLATPDVAQTFFAGREAELIGRFVMPFALVDRSSISDRDIAEFARGYARPNGWSGAQALYGSMLKEGDELRALVDTRPLALPILAMDRAGSSFTADALRAVHRGALRRVLIPDVGHYIAQEAPRKLADALLPFLAEVDSHVDASAG